MDRVSVGGLKQLTYILITQWVVGDVQDKRVKNPVPLPPISGPGVRVETEVEDLQRHLH